MVSAAAPTAEKAREARKAAFELLRAKRAAGKAPRVLHRLYKQPERGRATPRNLAGTNTGVPNYMSTRPVPPSQGKGDRDKIGDYSVTCTKEYEHLDVDFWGKRLHWWLQANSIRFFFGVERGGVLCHLHLQDSAVNNSRCETTAKSTTLNLEPTFLSLFASLQVPTPVAAPAGMCDDGSAAGQITVSLSVSVTRPTARGARETAAASANAVLTAVRQIAGIQPMDVQNTVLTLTPQTVYDKTNQQNITGYQFTNGIQVTVNGLTGDLLANVTDTAVQAGGDDVSIDSINFDLSAGVKAQALMQASQQATQDAKSTAGLFASQLEVTLDHVVSFNEPSPNVSVPTPLSTMRTITAAFASGAAATPTPVSVGQ
ncbi:hypothetical protein WJX82_009340 [Trebouxia sp. C0006]